MCSAKSHVYIHYPWSRLTVGVYHELLHCWGFSHHTRCHGVLRIRQNNTLFCHGDCRTLGHSTLACGALHSRWPASTLTVTTVISRRAVREAALFITCLYPCSWSRAHHRRRNAAAPVLGMDGVEMLLLHTWLRSALMHRLWLQAACCNTWRVARTAVLAPHSSSHRLHNGFSSYLSRRRLQCAT